MVDSARHWLNPNVLLSLMDALSYVKMNKLEVGFGIDWSYTVESLAFPNLTDSSYGPKGTQLDLYIQKKDANKLACPPEVEQQVWDDWYALRKAKNAPITQTVVATALVQAGKANITLNDYLKIWCARGSQGMKAEWITDGEKTAGAGPSKFAGDI
jgi:hypothetical protein